MFQYTNFMERLELKDFYWTYTMTETKQDFIGISGKIYFDAKIV